MPGTQSESFELIKLPEDCRFLGNLDDMNRTISHIIHKALENKDRKGKKTIFMNFTEVKYLDAATVNVLLALVNYLNILGFDVQGNIPNDAIAKKALIDSDFFSHVETNHALPSGSDTIFTISGDRQTNEDAVGGVTRKIYKALMGEDGSYHPLYTTLGEIAANSVEHANKKEAEKNWFMSVHCEEDRVLVLMADIGEGILETIKLLYEQTLYSRLMLERPHSVLRNMFAGKYQSSTLQPNRNTGLPNMVPLFQKGFIKNIIVVANNAIYDFSENNTGTLNNSFPGTFYLIEVTKDNIVRWQNRLN